MVRWFDGSPITIFPFAVCVVGFKNWKPLRLKNAKNPNARTKLTDSVTSIHQRSASQNHQNDGKRLDLLSAICSQIDNIPP
jgi:hypothetical protein